MRLMVFFDLPVKTRADRRCYGRFHRFLVRDGYDMIQFSVYARICNGDEALQKHLARLLREAPDRGSVRWMQVTERQFAGIGVVTGRKKRVEQSGVADQLSLF